MPVILTTTLLAGGKQTRTPILSPRLIQLLVLLLFLFPALSRARSVSQEKEREPLGSLTRVGEVYVNDSPAPAEITIFSGDRVRTGDSGSATFNMSGKGSLKISPRSQVLFSGKYEYTAELEAGVVAMNSINGPNGLTLRIGSDVVVPSTKEQSASSRWFIPCFLLEWQRRGFNIEGNLGPVSSGWSVCERFAEWRTVSRGSGGFCYPWKINFWSTKG
ncbi:MAG: hypothetical protein DMG43_12050 [Acidobacteria bacterium]|nr:MAG: hypothetical protein DMG43_12050 [Acidobacteriota bacterium]